jgi:hypothetical protein
MNGSGKSGIQADPARPGYLIGKIGTLANLSVQGPSNAHTVTAVLYRKNNVNVDHNKFSLTVLAGTNQLQIVVARVLPEALELLDSNGQILAQFNSDSVVYEVEGT